MVVAIIGILILLAILPRLIESFFDKSQDKTQEEITTEKEEVLKRQEKGALANTVDFIFGEGTANSLTFDKPPDEDEIITNLKLELAGKSLKIIMIQCGT